MCWSDLIGCCRFMGRAWSSASMKTSAQRLVLDIPEVCIFFSWMRRRLPTGPWTISSLTAVTLTLVCTKMVSWQFSYAVKQVIHISEIRPSIAVQMWQTHEPTYVDILCVQCSFTERVGLLSTFSYHIQLHLLIASASRPSFIEHHILEELLPPKPDFQHNLRKQHHNITLPSGC